MHHNCVQQTSISTEFTSSMFSRGGTFVFRYYSLRGDTAMSGGLYAWLCHAFLVVLLVLLATFSPLTYYVDHHKNFQLKLDSGEIIFARIRKNALGRISANARTSPGKLG